MPQAIGLLFYCRPGFEGECAAEAGALLQRQGLSGFARAKPDTGYTLFQLHESADAAGLLDSLPMRHWIFPRQRLAWLASIADLPADDRLSPLRQAIAGLGQRFGGVLGETADTNEAKELSGFLKRFMPHLERALQEDGLLRTDERLPRLHLFFHDSSRVELALAYPKDASPWPMGIPRLRQPRGAPSRSALKLVEALHSLLDEQERSQFLRAGQRAVDLGAAPGGWTWVFVERGLRVTAVDNGALAPAVLATEMVEHARADGFTWRPRAPVDWMVCDMVEQPARIAALVADWVGGGRCKRAIFNLKLPMKKRLDEVDRCCTIIDKRMRQTAGEYTLRLRHLYHDREEITGYLARIE